MVERCSVTRRSRHLIFQNAPKVGSAGVGTVDKRSWLPRYHWAGPSTSLDEFTIRPILSYLQGQVNLEALENVEFLWGPFLFQLFHNILP